MIIKEYCDFLAHHGIKGQRRGHRRWQNEDGTLTEAGKERYNAMSSRDKKIYNQYSETAKGIDYTNQKLKKQYESGKIPWYQSKAKLERSISKNNKDIKEIRKLAEETISNAKIVPLSEIKEKNKAG